VRATVGSPIRQPRLDPRRTGLQAPGLRERVLGGLADDEVIEDSHVDELQRLAEASRDELVGVAGFGDGA